jgi:hypothetical protein
VSPTQSLAAQRGHGVDGESSARGNRAGECSHQNEHTGRGQNHDRITRSTLDSAGNETIQTEAECKTGDYSQAYIGSGRQCDQAQHVAAPRSESDANAQLTGALHDRVGDYAVQAHRSDAHAGARDRSFGH